MCEGLRRKLIMNDAKTDKILNRLLSMPAVPVDDDSPPSATEVAALKTIDDFEEFVNERERLFALASESQTVQYLGKDYSLDQIKTMSSVEILRL